MMEIAKRQQESTVIDQPELSLGPSSPPSLADEGCVDISSSRFDACNCRKRKHMSWNEDEDEPVTQASNIDLQLNHPLPLDWEQCLDLQSGRMYYLNRKTSKKSWMRPKEQKLNLDLNIFTLPNSDDITVAAAAVQDDSKKQKCTNGNMVAVACFNCHLLVMLCRASPTCPNCKFVNKLLPQVHKISPRKMEPSKPLETLSLLH